MGKSSKLFGLAALIAACGLAAAAIYGWRHRNTFKGVRSSILPPRGTGC